MKSISALIFLSAIVFLSCNLPQEKKGIPVIPAISLEDEFVIEDLIASLDTMKAWGLNSLTIEIPIWADSTGFPSVHDSVFPFAKQIGAVLSGSTIHLSVSYVTRDDELLENWFRNYPPERLKEPPFPILSLFTDSLLSCLSPVKPERIIFGPGWQKKDQIHPDFTLMMSNLKKSGILVSHVSDIESIEMDPLLNESDEIAISYSPGLHSQQRQYYQKWNRKISEISQKTGKPILIAKANLVGFDAQVILMNLPFFWNDNCTVNGLIMNTVSTRICLADSSPYYGMQKNIAFREQLSSYLDKTH